MMTICIYSRFNRPKTEFSPSSSGFAPVYEERIDSDGKKILVKTGEHNLNDFIQASLDSTLVYNILDRFQKGDVSVLEKVKSFYADVTTVPKTILETHNFMKSISKSFDILPADLKAKFDNSVDVFVSKLENGEFNKILGEIAQPGQADRLDSVGEVAQKKEGEK